MDGKDDESPLDGEKNRDGDGGLGRFLETKVFQEMITKFPLDVFPVASWVLVDIRRVDIWI